MRLLLRPRSRWSSYLFAVLSPGAVSLLVWSLQSGGSKVPLYPLFTLGVICSALIGGLGPGLLAHVLSLFFIYLILLPHFLSAVGNRPALTSYIAYGAVGFSVCILISSLRTLQIELAAIVDSMAERVYVCDRNGRPLLTNESFRKLYGGLAPVYPQAFEERVEVRDLHGNPVPVSDWPISRVFRGEEVKGLELQVQPKNSDSVFFNSYNATPVLDSSGNIQLAVMTVEDITGRKQTEQALIRSEKLAATGRFAATIAHEVNNPLAAATNALYLAQSDPTLTAQTRHYLDLVENELRRAAHITRQTLGFYRESGSQQAVAIPKLVDEIVEVYAWKLQDRNINIQRRYMCGPCGAGCDACFLVIPGELRQVISNLLANGIDALQENGTLHIRVSRMTSCSCNANGEQINLTIADNGTGIRVHHLKRIFEPFFTTKESVGTGLGLWVTQELVRKHNGVIKVRSQEGKGTVFRISFPAAPVPTPEDRLPARHN